MNQSDIRVGMRVKVIGYEDGNRAIIDKVGVVVSRRSKRIRPYDCAVQFSRPGRELWDCQGLCPDNRGFMFDAENIKKMPALKKKAGKA